MQEPISIRVTRTSRAGKQHEFGCRQLLVELGLCTGPSKCLDGTDHQLWNKRAAGNGCSVVVVVVVVVVSATSARDGELGTCHGIHGLTCAAFADFYSGTYF